jgi:hypothetical protein
MLTTLFAGVPGSKFPERLIRKQALLSRWHAATSYGTALIESVHDLRKGLVAWQSLSC